MKRDKGSISDAAIIRQFDPLLRSADEGLSAAIAAFVIDLERREAGLGVRSRNRSLSAQRTFHLAVHALLCNFMTTWQCSPHALLNIGLSNGLLRGSPRYRPEVYGKPFRDLIELLVDLGMIEMVTKGYNVERWARKERTTIRWTKKLRTAFPSITQVARNVLTRIDPPEVIVLKDGEQRLCDYVDTTDTNRWRTEIQEINGHLGAASVSVVSAEGLGDENGLAIRTDARSLRRIWNNIDWDQGGRLYDGFWQTTKREDRLHVIQIDGEAIANVDFSQFNLRLAYALTKVRPPSGDLYKVEPGDDLTTSWAHLREGRKKLTNAMFNRDKPLKQWPGKTSKDRYELSSCFMKGTTPRTATADIRKKHSAIAHYFEAGHGLRFMRIESDILVATLLSLMKRGITALPIHDAVLVRADHAHTAKATMEREAKRRIGTVIRADITTIGTP